MKTVHLLSFLSFVTFTSLHGHPDTCKPTLEELVNANKVKISFECYRDEQDFDKESWQNIVVATSTLLDQCQNTALTDAHFKEIYNTVDYIRNERREHPCPAIHGLVSVSVGQPSEKISYLDHAQNLVWLGCITTGQYPNEDSLKEICVIITDPQLNMIAQSPIFELDQESAIDKIEMAILDFIKHYTHEKPILLGRDRIIKHRALLKKCMPTLEAYFSTVTMNCFSMREFCMLWQRDVFHRNEIHSSLEAAYDAIAEAKFYKEKYFQLAQ